MIARLERVTYGDDYARVPGLLNQVEGLRGDLLGLRTDVSTLRNDITTVQQRKPNVWLWALGYVAFLVSGAFAMSAFYSIPEIRALLAMPPPDAVALALVFLAAAALLFAGGFGWLRGG
jgi:hypothetical protein